jgi:cation diffusion facilitator CzcD-associated flavoprotein CzcO
MKKIAVIGFGAASIGYVNELKDKNFELHIFERSKDIISSSLSGIRSDGKIFISKEMGGKLDLDLDIQRDIVDFYLKKSEVPENKIEHGFSFQSKRKFTYGTW